MLWEASEVGTKGGRVRPQSGSRREPARKSSRRRHALESLEPRTLLATATTLATPTVVANSQVDITTNSKLSYTAPTTATGGGNTSTPSIVVDKNNPNLLAAVWTLNNPARARPDDRHPCGRLEQRRQDVDPDCGQLRSDPRSNHDEPGPPLPRVHGHEHRVRSKR